MPEIMTEVDMSLFSKRIGPYFTWLESNIESGWQQNEMVQKDVLKEVRSLATNMRARFILGVSKEDFSKEVSRVVELFELAAEAFPDESDEVENKLTFFCKGIAEEFGEQFLPKDHLESSSDEEKAVALPVAQPSVHAPSEKISPPKIVALEKLKVASTAQVYVKVEAPAVKPQKSIRQVAQATQKVRGLPSQKVVVKDTPKKIDATKKITKSSVQQTKMHVKQTSTKKHQQTASVRNKKFSPMRFIRSLLYGD